MKRLASRVPLAAVHPRETGQMIR